MNAEQFTLCQTLILRRQQWKTNTHTHTRPLFLWHLFLCVVKCNCILIKKISHVLASESINVYNYKIIETKNSSLNLSFISFFLIKPFLSSLLTMIQFHIFFYIKLGWSWRIDEEDIQKYEFIHILKKLNAITKKQDT